MTLIGGGPLLVAANGQSALQRFDENFGSKITGSQDFESCSVQCAAVQCSARLAGQVRADCYAIDVLWVQPIKLIQVVSTSEFHEY